MNSWSKIASTLVVVAGLGLGQTTPASNPSTVGTSPSTTAPATSSPPPEGASAPPVAVAQAVGAPVAAQAPAKTVCAPGPAWQCVAQTLQAILFNPDGTHRADSDITKDFPIAISGLIRDGIMKPQDAPATPITSFDDANKYVNNYPTGAGETVTVAPSAAPPPKPAPCPADRPWLCDSPPPIAGASAKPATTKPNTATSASGSAKAPAPAKGKPAKPGPDTGQAAGGAPAAADSPLYVLGPNDVVSVSVFDEAHVSSTYAIGPDGRISMPLVGNFPVIGLTLPQLTELLTQKLRDIGGILEPVVNVQLLRNNSKQFLLIGGVGRSGEQPLLRETTILDALSAAGFKEFANKKKIILRRGTKEFKFNYNEVVKGIHMEQNIPIEDGDTIYVPE